MHAEIERLKANANICGIGAGCLHKLATIESQAAEIEILKQEHAQRTMFKKTDDAAFVKQVEETTELRAENQKLRDALEDTVGALRNMHSDTDETVEGYALVTASAALGDAK